MARLVAARPLSGGHEVTVEERIHLLGSAEPLALPFELTFDGGAREVRGERVGGAGATAWTVDPHTGLARCMVEATMALPRVANAALAEAGGGGLALQRTSCGCWAVLSDARALVVTA